MASNVMYDLNAIRNQMRKRKGGGAKDPNEWRPDKAESGKPLKWKFFILPPVDNMELWYYEHGQHWIENKKIECPRIHDGTHCPLCQFGFDLMNDVKDKEGRRQIARQYLASARYAINIYFPNVSGSPQDLRGKVMWFSMPQSVYAIMEEVIMRDTPESDALEPEPHGIFFDPKNAIPFVLEAKRKGDFNSYESSHFINKTMSITKGGDEKIEEILGMRHDIPNLYNARDVDELQAIVDNISGNVSVDKAEEKPQAKSEEPKSTAPASDDDDDLDMDEELDDTPQEAPKTESKKDDEAQIEVEDDDLNALLEDLGSDD